MRTPEVREVRICTDWIELGALLKLAQVAPTGGVAKLWIQEGKVRVNGQAERRRARRVLPGDRVEVEEGPVLVIIGGGHATE